jgi:hypothetical protein
MPLGSTSRTRLKKSSRLMGFTSAAGFSREGEADGLGPATTFAMEGVAGGSMGHGEKPPAFFPGETAPNLKKTPPPQSLV